MEVETVNDLKVLFDIGALTPDMSIELSKILLGNAARPSQRGKTEVRHGANTVNRVLSDNLSHSSGPKSDSKDEGGGYKDSAAAEKDDTVKKNA
jgi:hypothetical protein